MASNKPTSRQSEAEPRQAESKEAPAPAGSADPEDLQIPEDVQRSDPAPPADEGSDLVFITPTSNGIVTVPSGASFQLFPGTAVQMQKKDADFLTESGLA